MDYLCFTSTLGKKTAPNIGLPASQATKVLDLYCGIGNISFLPVKDTRAKEKSQHYILVQKCLVPSKAYPQNKQTSMTDNVSFPVPVYEGKIRSLYPADDDSLIMLTSDRISAFDVIFAETVAGKGTILNQISCAWCKALQKSGLCEQYGFSTHLLSDRLEKFPPPYCHIPAFSDRAVHIKKTKRIDFECIVRGYLAGSAWQDYQAKGSVCNIALEPGLSAAAKLKQPLFTPSTKAEVGEHDENVPYVLMQQQLGKELSGRLRDISLAIYGFAVNRMAGCGILLADTKFEFGLCQGQLVLIDEVLTPDSSRYWKVEDYQTAKASDRIPPGYDKQHIRDYAQSLGWNKKPPAPKLPLHTLNKTKALYQEIQQRIEAELS